MNENVKLKQAEQKLTELKEQLEKIKEKWKEFMKLTLLELAINRDKVRELKDIIENNICSK